MNYLLCFSTKYENISADFSLCLKRALVEIVFFFKVARRLSTQQKHKHSQTRLEPVTPSTEKQAGGFSPLLLSVLRLIYYLLIYFRGRARVREK